VTIIDQGCRSGVLAFGDSITNGGGELQWGVALQSWALWVARGLGLPFTSHAFDGADARDVVDIQIPAQATRSVPTDRRYELGCLYIGVNDVRSYDWDPQAFRRDHAIALTFLQEHCDRLLTLTVPHDLGRPPAGAKVLDANEIIAGNARRAGALVLDLSTFGGRGLLMADHVHPTAFGQIAIGEAALALLEGCGFTVVARPQELISYSISWSERLRFDLRYARRSARALLEARWRLWRARH
jgi:lysophospholipase L1-like esterase